MGKINVVGLGPGNIEDLTMGAINTMNNGYKNFLRTEKHPTVKYFLDNGIEFSSYDDIYDYEEDFNKVYKKIVSSLIEEAKKEKVINYYVPGNPMVAEKTVELLLEKDVEIQIISGMSFIEPMIELVKRDPINGLKIVDGAVFHRSMININMDMIITQVYNKRILSEIKLILSEIYGDEYLVYLIHGAGIKGQEVSHYIPLYKLDRMEEISSLTSIYLPKLAKINKNKFDFNDLIDIMGILRDTGGCSWDMEQTHKSLRSHLIEEAYEVIDAIDREDIEGLIEELGDLLLQVIFHSQIGHEAGDFNIYDITSGLGNKLIYRHPHVFNEKNVEKPEEIVYNWNMLKYAKQGITRITDRLKNVPRVSAIMSSYKIQEKVAEIGFDWDHISGALDKTMEEYAELKEAIEIFGGGSEEAEGELGDLLFSVVNLARFAQVDPEIALNKTIDKFINRLEKMEEEAERQEKVLEGMTLEELNILWDMAKNHEDKK